MPDVPRDRLPHRLRLLVDLLQHVRVVSASLRRRVIPRDQDLPALPGVPLGRDHTGALGGDRDDLIVLDEHHPLGVANESARRRREEHLAVSNADQQRALAPSPDQKPRLLAVDNQKRKMALELAVGRSDGIDERPPVRAPHKMGNHLGVRLGRKHLAVRDELPADLAVVLDDAIEDNRDIVVIARHQRMSVILADPPMRRPARVADPGGRRGRAPGLALEVLDLADCPYQFEVAVPQQADTRRVVASVFKALKPAQQSRRGIPPPYVSDYAAHPCPVPL